MRLASFCLNTQTVLPRHGQSSISTVVLKAVDRSVRSALDLLNLQGNIGPMERDSLRFFPGFLFVSMSYCMTYVLRAIQSFPQLKLDTAEILDQIGEIAAFMTDVSIDRSHDSAAMGHVVLSQLRITRDKLREMNAQQARTSNRTQAVGETSASPTISPGTTIPSASAEEPSPVLVSQDYDEYGVDMPFYDHNILFGSSEFGNSPVSDGIWDVFQQY